MNYRRSLILMRHLALLLWCALLGAASSQTILAQAPSREPGPVLLVPAAERAEPLKLQNIETHSRIVGHLAATQMTMTFYNPNNRVLAGNLYAPLPEGAAVSGYALDVDGALVDGVVVEKHEARRIFEKEVRKGVDPGLVEWVGGNHFHTRVFPIPAGGTRTIRVSFVAEVDERSDGAQWTLPLQFNQKVNSFSVRVEVVDPAQAPRIEGRAPAGLTFTRNERVWVAEASGNNVALTEPVVVKLPAVQSAPVQLERSADGNVYFSIRVSPPPLSGPPPATLQADLVRIFWDASGSRATADTAREIALVKSTLEELGQTGTEVELVVFRDRAEAAKSFRLPLQLPRLLETLANLPYDGGTQLAAASPQKPSRAASLTLLVSDGVSSFGPAEMKEAPGMLVSINSSPTANHAYLRHVAQRSGGIYLNLGRIDDAQAVAALRDGARWRLTVTAGAGATAITPSSGRTVQGASSVSGVLKAESATVKVKFEMQGRAATEQSYEIRRDAASYGEVLRREWAQRTLDELVTLPQENAERILALGQEHGIVTPGTSLLVLERLEQYVEYRVRPPASLEAMRAEYDRQIALAAKAKVEMRASKLEEVVELWRNHVEWWETKFEVPKGFRYRGGEEKKEGGRRSAEAPGDMAPAPAGAPMEAMREEEASSARDSADADPRSMSKAKKSAGADKDDRSVDAAIVMAAWQPDTPYIRALEKAEAKERYKTYLLLRKDNASAPSFFLDCADYFERAKEPELGLRILSNLAELSFEDPALLRVLAHRLAQLEQLDRAAETFEQVLRIRPEEPQSYRDLALVLSRRGDSALETGNREAARTNYERAMELLVEVILKRWDRFAEIETIALMELNRIYARARQVGVTKAPIDERLIKLLDVDVRIVMTWDADMTDMDLHVVEPSGEEAYYSHNRTTIGGMVSRDFTQGYGPEVYQVKKGMNGTYEIRTKFFGSSAASLQGAVTLQVDVFTNYGRATEKRRSITFRLTENKEMFTVGQIEL